MTRSRMNSSDPRGGTTLGASIARFVLGAVLAFSSLWAALAVEPWIHSSLPESFVGLPSTRVAYAALVAGLIVGAFVVSFKSRSRATTYVLLLLTVVAFGCASIVTMIRYIWPAPWFAEDGCASLISGVNVTRCYGDASSRYRPFQSYAVFEGTITDVMPYVDALAFARASCSCDGTDTDAVRTVVGMPCSELNALSDLRVEGEPSCALCRCVGNYDDLTLIKVGRNKTVAGFQGSSIQLSRTLDCVLRRPGCFAYTPPRGRDHLSGIR